MTEGTAGYIPELCRQAKSASRSMALAPREQKDAALRAMAAALQRNAAEILTVNQQDIRQAQTSGLSPALVDRLSLTPERLNGIISSLEDVAMLPDPVGAEFDQRVMPNGLVLHKQRVPLGLIAVVYESRPNVTIEVASLALKSGNALVLRGGSETITTNRALVAAVRSGLAHAGLPQEAVQFIEDPDRNHVLTLLKMHDQVDMLIPRGGNALHSFCRENSSIPVITGGIGICHLFIDDSADLEAALPVIRNAKVQRPSVCNALDTLLVHQSVSSEFLPRVVDQLKKDGVTFRAEPLALSFLTGADPSIVQPAGPEDFDTEWLSLVLGLKVVADVDEAIRHIAEHSTAHSDGILSANDANITRFVYEVDSAVVYVNASTRFTDGGQMGMGAEVAVSTQRLHARGPMALEELTTYKWVARGQYHIRA